MGEAPGAERLREADDDMLAELRGRQRRGNGLEAERVDRVGGVESVGGKGRETSLNCLRKRWLIGHVRKSSIGGREDATICRGRKEFAQPGCRYRSGRGLRVVKGWDGGRRRRRRRKRN